MSEVKMRLDQSTASSSSDPVKKQQRNSQNPGIQRSKMIKQYATNK